jgi:hypothetical protein
MNGIQRNLLLCPLNPKNSVSGGCGRRGQEGKPRVFRNPPADFMLGGLTHRQFLQAASPANLTAGEDRRRYLLPARFIPGTGGRQSLVIRLRPRWISSTFRSTWAFQRPWNSKAFSLPEMMITCGGGFLVEPNPCDDRDHHPHKEYFLNQRSPLFMSYGRIFVRSS